jgi:hypothetical protein
MIVDPNTAASARPPLPTGPLEKQQPLEARPVEGTAGGLASRLDVQGDRAQQHPDVKDKDAKGNSRPMAYNTKGAPKKVSLSELGGRSGTESVDLFV